MRGDKAAIRHQNVKSENKISTSSLKTFISFIPTNIIKKILYKPSLSILEESEWIEGAVIFSDISGFTPMSQALSNYGSRGTEEMSGILNNYLTKMSHIIYKKGGIIQKIAGDAMTILFEKQANVSWKVPLFYAVECAFGMQRLITEFRKIKTIAGEFSLEMKIGIGNGRLFTGTLGTYDFGIEPFLIGCPIENAVMSEHHAEQGEIWLHKDSMEKIKDNIKIIKKVEDFYRISKIEYKETEEPQSIKPNHLKISLSEPQKQKIISEIRSCVPLSIAKRIELGYLDFLGENRKTTILFISFEGLSLNDAEFESKLKSYYSTMQKIITRYRGFLYEFESGDKGSKIIALFGSPTSTEDDEGLAVHCANAMQDAVKDIDWIVSQKIGISTGSVFAGVIGTNLLSRYAVIGDRVNLAARLMSLSESNTILCDEETFINTGSNFKWEAKPPRKVKGKTGLIKTYEFKGIKKSSKPSTVDEISYLIGREDEAKQFVQVFDKVIKNSGQIISVIGEMGMGKKSLIKEFVKFVKRRGMKILRADSFSYGTQIPYFEITELFRNLFNIKENDSNNTKIERINDFIDKLMPKQKDKIPLLESVLSIELPDNEANDWAKNLDPSVRKANMIDFMSKILIEYSKQQALLIIINDLHWSNSSTLDFLNTLSKNIKDEKLLIIFSYQPFSNIVPESLSEIKKLDYHNNIVLNELTSEQCMDFINIKWKITNIPDNFPYIVKNNAGGNPYYVEILMNSLIKSGQLYHNKKEDSYTFSERAFEHINIPDSIHALILSQMDRVDETSKLLIKVASVVGMVFNQDIVIRIFPDKISKTTLFEKLYYLSEQGLLENEEKDGEQRFYFRNELTLETAYNNLPFTQRKALHEKTAITIEELYSDKIDSYYDILAYHFKHTDITEKKLKYLSLAGNKARNNYANKEAVNYYEQVSKLLENEISSGSIEATSEKWDDIGCELFDTYLILGDITKFVGEMDLSKGWLQKAESIIIKLYDEKRRYRLLQSFGEWYEFRDQYMLSLEYYSRAYKCISKQKNLMETSLSCGHLGNLYRTIGKYDIALKRYKEAASLANKAASITNCTRNIMLEGRWLGNIGIIYANQGSYDKALKYYFDALKISKTVQDKLREVAWLSLIANVYVAQSKYEGALKYAYESLEVANNIGYKRSAVMTMNTIGNTYRFLGEYDRALEVHHKALDTANNIGAINQEVICMGEIGEIYRIQERYIEALDFYKKAYSKAKTLGDKYNQALWERAIGIVYYNSPEPEVKKAKQHLKNAMDTASSIGHKKLLAEIMMHLGNAYSVDGEHEEAEKYIKKGLSIAQKIKHPGLSIWGKRVLGIVLIKLGKKDEGTKILTEALKKNEELGLKKDVAECSFELGKALKDNKYLKRAYDIFDELGLEARKIEVEEHLDNL